MTKRSNTIILHDTFLYRGGGERLVMYMRDILDCDLVSGFFDPGSYSIEEIRANASEDAMIRPLTRSRIFTKGIRHIKLKLAFLFRTKFLKDYDTVIFSGDCLAAVRNVRPETKKVFYCHTPPRYIFDKRQWYEDQLSKHYGFFYLLIRPVYRWVRSVFEQAYRRDIAAMDVVVVNSSEVQKRVKKYFGIEAEIVYPPVDLHKFGILNSEFGINGEEYYLSFGRLADFKRVDVIIEAFRKMPEKRLIITYGKNDPAKEKLIQQANGHDNIEFRTDVSDDEAVALLSGAVATIYIPKDEDFGMVPIESMACGTPVIGVDEGGLKETILDGETGFLVDPDDLVKGLITAVQKLDGAVSTSMSSASLERSSQFSLDTFSDKIGDLILD